MKMPMLTKNDCKAVFGDDFILLFFIFITVLAYIFYVRFILLSYLLHSLL